MLRPGVRTIHMDAKPVEDSFVRAPPPLWSAYFAICLISVLPSDRQTSTGEPPYRRDFLRQQHRPRVSPSSDDPEIRHVLQPFKFVLSLDMLFGRLRSSRC